MRNACPRRSSAEPIFAIRNIDTIKIIGTGFNCLWLRENSWIMGIKMTVSYPIAALVQVSLVRCQPHLGAESDAVDIQVLRTR